MSPAARLARALSLPLPWAIPPALLTLGFAITFAPLVTDLFSLLPPVA